MKKPHGRENDTVAVVPEVPKSEVALREEIMLAFWREHDIFNKTVATPAGEKPKGDFVFYDGPPFATGLPHYGHILAGTMKDAVPRFWTMNGYRVERKWGWDCHGLPLENLIEKELGLAAKKDIEDYGIKNFNEKARGAVMRYADDWRKIVPRMGRFVDMENDYKTMDSSYTESVWWVFKSLHDKGLVTEGFKSMHLCPRCGTTLSNFEVNQGYKDIKDIAVTVKLPLLDEKGSETNASLLVWTTTPWTLPGNTAAAVHNEIQYVKVKVTLDEKAEFFILAKGRVEQLGEVPYKVVEEMKGSDLVGIKYVPPFSWLAAEDFEGKENAWKIYHADYVEVGEDGTGAVHIAPAYGDDDMKLAQANDVPIHHHVDEAGHFKPFVKEFAGLLVKPKDDEATGVDHKDTDIEILRFLQASGVILKKENITHSYPHCWRCETPLLNYATTSWFVNVPSMKEQLIEANNTVQWVPENVGKNRFGKWLEGARDWAISRQRYWGAPLPIWKNTQTGDYKVCGSLKELQEYVPKSGNQYLFMRHAESESNAAHTVQTDISVANPLTEKGLSEAKAVIGTLESKQITKIIASPFERTTETAKIVAARLGIKEEEIVFDERLQEIQLPEFEGKSGHEYQSFMGHPSNWYEKKPETGESWSDVRKRVGAFLYEIESTYKNENILVIAHNSPLRMMQLAACGETFKDYFDHDEDGHRFNNTEVREVQFIPLPHNDNYEIDFHRPYIDEIVLEENGVKLERVPDVFDCWFESGSMPYAQHHYLGNDSSFEGKKFPAQFIAEGLDQTRGWFYSLLVLGTALFGKSPFENVMVNGLVLAEDGKKMSKSLSNYPDPMELANRTGVDAMRFYLLSSPVVKGEDLNFSEKEVLEIQRKNIGRLHNVLQMYELFADETIASSDSSQVLDKWIITRLNQLITEATAGYKSYELDKATRPITDFIDDVSVWYLRRSRDRLKGEDIKDRALALGTLRHVLQTLSLVMAPVMPFYAEYLWQAVREAEDSESVHLGKWPAAGKIDTDLLVAMDDTREVVTAALEARTKAGIKVRQPLASLATNRLLTPEFANIVADEVNVKSVTTDGGDTAVLNILLNEDLLKEGSVRELMRAVQGKRKSEGLEPADEIVLTVQTDESGTAAIMANQELLIKTVGAKDLKFEVTEGDVVTADNYSFTFSITKL